MEPGQQPSPAPARLNLGGLGEEESLGVERRSACVGLDGGGALAPGALEWSAGEGASDCGGEGRPKRGSGSRLERRRQLAGKDAGDANDGGAW